VLKTLFLMDVSAMLIEAAFFKLSDYFQSIESPSELYEEQVAFIFAVALYQELQNRGFSFLLPYIQLGRPYPNERNKRVDIYFRIPKNKLPPEILHRWAESGVCEENWIEVKFFGSAERSLSNKTKTKNIALILTDLLRLKYYVNEGGKYLLLVFNRDPQYYLSKRDYLKYLLEPGTHKIVLNIADETKTILETIKKHFRDQIYTNIIELETLTHTIKPLPVKGLIITSPDTVPIKKSLEGLPRLEPQYYFYLIRILEFIEYFT
jgi:hypothetical protein